MILLLAHWVHNECTSSDLLFYFLLFLFYFYPHYLLTISLDFTRFKIFAFLHFYVPNITSYHFEFFILYFQYLFHTFCIKSNFYICFKKGKCPWSRCLQSSIMVIKHLILCYETYFHLHHFTKYLVIIKYFMFVYFENRIYKLDHYFWTAIAMFAMLEFRITYYWILNIHRVNVSNFWSLLMDIYTNLFLLFHSFNQFNYL